MKPILFAGAALMFGASVYGFADYKKSGGRNVTDMYAKKSVKPDTSGKKVMQDPVKAVKDSKSISEEPSKAGRKTTSATTVSSPAEQAKNLKAGKKIKSEFFSRAPLKDTEEEVKEIPAVKDKDVEVKNDQ